MLIRVKESYVTRRLLTQTCIDLGIACPVSVWENTTMWVEMRVGIKWEDYKSATLMDYRYALYYMWSSWNIYDLITMDMAL